MTTETIGTMYYRQREAASALLAVLKVIAECQTAAECPARPADYYRVAFNLFVAEARKAVAGAAAAGVGESS